MKTVGIKKPSAKKPGLRTPKVASPHSTMHAGTHLSKAAILKRVLTK